VESDADDGGGRNTMEMNIVRKRVDALVDRGDVEYVRPSYDWAYSENITFEVEMVLKELSEVGVEVYFNSGECLQRVKALLA